MSKKIVKSIIFLLLIPICFFLLPNLVGLDSPTEGSVVAGLEEQLDKRLVTATALFAGTKLICGLLNFLQAIELELNVIVAGAHVNPLVVLAPLSASLDKLSNLFLLAMGAIVLQKVMMVTGGWLALKVILPFTMVLAILSLWVKAWAEKFRRATLILVVLSFIAALTMPVSIGLASGLENYFLADMVKKAEMSIEESKKAIEELPTEFSKTEETGSFLSRARDTLSLDIMKQKATETLESIINEAKETANNLVAILVAFLITTVIIPLGTVLGLWFLAKWALRSLSPS